MSATSLRELARRLGCSHQALSKAFREHRLTAGLDDVDGEIMVTDPDECAKQWAAIRQMRPSKRAPVEREPTDAPSYEESRARREAALADLAELDVAERRGELISVEQARKEVLDSFATVRVRVLGVPSRVAQRLPRLAAEIVPVIDELLREALEELADGDSE